MLKCNIKNVEDTIESYRVFGNEGQTESGSNLINF